MFALALGIVVCGDKHEMVSFEALLFDAIM